MRRNFATGRGGRKAVIRSWHRRAPVASSGPDPEPESAMTDQPPRRLFRQPHARRPLRGWIVALVLIVAVMVLLPRLLALLD